MRFYFDDDHNEEIPLVKKDSPELWAAMLAEGITEWLLEMHVAEETL